MELLNLLLELISHSFLFFLKLYCHYINNICFIVDHPISQCNLYPVVHDNPISSLGVITVMWGIPILAYAIRLKLSSFYYVGSICSYYLNYGILYMSMIGPIYDFFFQEDSKIPEAFWYLVPYHYPLPFTFEFIYIILCTILLLCTPLNLISLYLKLLK